MQAMLLRGYCLGMMYCGWTKSVPWAESESCEVMMVSHKCLEPLGLENLIWLLFKLDGCLYVQQLMCVFTCHLWTESPNWYVCTWFHTSVCLLFVLLSLISKRFLSEICHVMTQSSKITVSNYVISNWLFLFCVFVMDMIEGFPTACSMYVLVR